MNFVKYTRIFILLFIPFINQQPAASALSFSTVITVAQSTMDVAQFALDINEFVTRKENNQDGEVQKIIKATDLLIAASTTKILNTILLQSKLERIDDAVIAIHSSLIDVKKMINSTDQNTFEIYKEDYIRFYVEHDLIKHIRFLPGLLMYNVPGVGSELLTEIIRHTRCNMTALEEFTDFYLKLLSDGIALQVLYYKFTSSLSIDLVLKDEWKDPIDSVRKTLEGMITSCAKQFAVLARQDVNDAVNIDDLTRANQQRYIFKWSDVFFYASMGTEQFHYMKYKTGRLFRSDNGDNNKVTVFGRRETSMIWDAADIERKLNMARLSIPPDTDKEAAKDVAKQIEEYINSLGKSMAVVLVFFDSEDFEMTGIRLDTGSPIVKYMMEGVTLRYCFDVGIVCTYRKSRGTFRVYVYPGQVDDSDDFETDGAATKYTLPSLLLAIVFYIALI